MEQGSEGPGYLLSFDVFPAELQRAGSKNQASDWPQIKPVQVTSEHNKPWSSETWSHASHGFGGTPPPHPREVEVLQRTLWLCLLVLKSEMSLGLA